MHLYKQLYKKLNFLPEDQIEQIYNAYLLAALAHSGQKRDDGASYLTHPVAVAGILADMHMDYQSIIAALLHDVVEDTPTSKDTIAEKFGVTVADLVDGVTKLTQIESASKAEIQAESFRKMVLAMSRDIRVILIKLADRWHNMQTIGGVAPNKRVRVAKETIDIYAPIANRLGMHNIYVELENLSFAALHPRRYRILKQSLEKARGNRKEIMRTIEKEMAQALTKTFSQDYSLLGREKHLYGIYKKMRARKMSFSDIMDVFAFRIIVSNIDDCYRALGAVHRLYKPVPGRFKDYIAIPKFNGYQSLHTTLFGPQGVPIEVQIRTPIMDQMANNGISAHWLYKTGDKLTDAAHVRAQQWINNLMEMQHNTGSSLEFIENVKVDLFPDEVYVFTPKGKIMELPRGATIVDFAYAVHTDIGNTCVAARIDHQFLSLSTVLKSGQTVSIITAPHAKPNPSWLNFVVTGRARSGIRNFLKCRKREESIVLGKQLLVKSLSDLSLSLAEIPDAAIKAILNEAKFESIDDLYDDIGLGNRLAVIVAHQLANALPDKKIDLVVEEPKPLLIRNAEGMAITFASCCGPIPGDLIVGYLNSGHGLDIHTEDCVNLAKYQKNPERRLPVSWADDVQGDFCAGVNVEMVNQRGALASLTKVISAENANIENISTSERSDGYSLIMLSLLVKDVAHLERVMRHIGSEPLVVGVIRRKGN